MLLSRGLRSLLRPGLRLQPFLVVQRGGGVDILSTTHETASGRHQREATRQAPLNPNTLHLKACTRPWTNEPL